MHMRRLTDVVFLLYSVTICQVSFNVFWYPLEPRMLIFLFSHIGLKGNAHVQRFVVGKGKAFSLSHTRERE